MRSFVVFSMIAAGFVLAGCSGNDDPMSATPDAAPKIVAMSPAPGHNFVPANQEFMVEFSEPMDRRSVEDAYQVMMGNESVMGDHAWNDEGTTMRFRPSGQFTRNTEMEIRWGRGMRSRGGMGMVGADGQSMEPFSFKFMMFQSPSSFSSNGERIYYTATSESGEPISFTMGTDFDEDAMPGYGMMGGMGTGMMGGGMMGGGMMMGSDGGQHSGMSCATCHGPDGSGGRYLAMGAVRTPNIQYAILTGQVELDEDGHEGEDEEGHDEAEEEEHGHEPYTDETLKRAITEGVEPDGEELDSFMPRWSMSDQDLEDLVSFLKTL
jgi:mono/diheme cytochrome c family protein